MLAFSFLPQVIKPTRITPGSQTLIDNIFFNGLQSNITAGNITTAISDHFTQFISIPHESTFNTENDSNKGIYKRNY